jgi:hypothetical protein
MHNAATLTALGVTLNAVVADVFSMLNGYTVNDADDTLEFVSECYDGAGELTYIEAANACARFATNGAVVDVSGLTS